MVRSVVTSPMFGIDRREPLDERMARALGIAVHPHRERCLGSLGADRHVDNGPPVCTPPNRKPATSRAMPTTTKVRERSGGSSGPGRGPPFGSGSSRRTCPIASRSGHSWRATLSDTTATAALALRSVGVKPRPRTMIDAEDAEVFRRDELCRRSATCRSRCRQRGLGRRLVRR